MGIGDNNCNKVTVVGDVERNLNTYGNEYSKDDNKDIQSFRYKY